MKLQLNDLQKNEIENRKLTTEEILSIDGFQNYSESDIEELKEFVYNIAIVLYKLYQNEQS
jgi:hypothetical protein